ncbi:MAG: TSUP family transporter [Nitrosomonas sp.]|nr:TSUP family transporter [Nitrosomonas sp.]
MELLLVSLASLCAGFVDSIVGGGGLILVPALFAMFPTTHPATLFGVNKGASVWGTAAATLQYARRVQMPWHALLPAAGVGFVGSMAGAWTVTIISPDFLRRALPVILLLVLAYTLARAKLIFAGDMGAKNWYSAGGKTCSMVSKACTGRPWNWPLSGR